MDRLASYREIWLADFEFRASAGERPEPVCLVAREFRSGRKIRLWADHLAVTFSPPISVGDDTLFVAFYASAELGCFQALGWSMPSRVLDLFAEFRCLTNGLGTVCGNSLLGALSYFGIDGINSTEKEEMRQLAKRGEPFTTDERADLLNYCESDVCALSELLPAMLPLIDLPRALLRGRYMAAAAKIEHQGVPIDFPYLTTLRNNWNRIKRRLTLEIDGNYGVYAPISDNSNVLGFSASRFAGYLARNGIPWPRLDSNRLALDDDTFRRMAKTNPVIAPLRELRHALGEMHLFEDLAVGSDGRNRCLLSAFRSLTGRNQPSNAKYIFGPSCWLRGLIKPAQGYAIAYIDWSQQEFGIAAALSGDEAMKSAYSTGDPYLAFARQAGAVPADATMESHRVQRERFKVCTLAVQYGMSSKSLAVSLDQPEAFARELLQLHRRTYPTYWKWNEAAVNHAMLRGYLWTVFGWNVHIGAKANPRSIANFPMQANGAEMLRLACCLATEKGIGVAAPVHDAMLIEAEDKLIEEAVEATQQCMVEASRIVLNGFELRSDATIIRWPNRYMDSRGERMWNAVAGIITSLESDAASVTELITQ